MKQLEIAAGVGMVITILVGPVFGCIYLYFLIYRYFDAGSSECIVKGGEDQPQFGASHDQEGAFNVTKMLYTNMLGIFVSGILFGVCFIQLAIRRKDTKFW